jgi:hypothetical protein
MTSVSADVLKAPHRHGDGASVEVSELVKGAHLVHLALVSVFQGVAMSRGDRDRPRRDRDVYIQEAPRRPAPQAHVGCGCSCGTCQSSHCHNMSTGCNVR